MKTLKKFFILGLVMLFCLNGGCAEPAIPALGGITAISAGWDYTCALTSEKGIKCWGNNAQGQLGDGSTEVHNAPVDVIDLDSDISAISAGRAHTCALTINGGVKCWGSDWYGELGDGESNQVFSTIPVDVSGMTSGVKTIVSGAYHTCALTSGGGVKCWGYNEVGQLGDGYTIDEDAPDLWVANLYQGVSAISAGANHTCAITTGGAVKCWGHNQYGQLGNNTNVNSRAPVDVSGLTSGIIALAAGDNHTCALTLDGIVKCWGFNLQGELGDGTHTNRWTPVDVTPLNSVISSITAGLIHTCAVTSDGGAKCWGANNNGQLGNNETEDMSSPVDVNDLSSNVLQLSGGMYHTCALITGSSVKCWGSNDFGQLGTGNTSRYLVPHNVDAFENLAPTLETTP
jgi:alpha-tubulin suppressor-like RCC1 family protein